MDGTIYLPPRKCVPCEVTKISHVFVGDDAFALKPHTMKPYPCHGLSADKRISNYRHSRERRLSENLFGIIANKWRMFRSVLQLSPRSIVSLVMAVFVIHIYYTTVT